MWAVVTMWIDDSDNGFGVLTTESCEEVMVAGIPIEPSAPLRAGDRVRIEFAGGAGDVISKLVRCD